jgi:hypothetical protein
MDSVRLVGARRASQSPHKVATIQQAARHAQAQIAAPGQ